MKLLTKAAILVTCLSVAALWVTSGVSQSLETDGKQQRSCVVLWHIPFYRTVRLPESAWWSFTRIWLVALCGPPLLWAAVGAQPLVARFRRPIAQSELKGHD